MTICIKLNGNLSTSYSDVSVQHGSEGQALGNTEPSTLFLCKNITLTQMITHFYQTDITLHIIHVLFF